MARCARRDASGGSDIAPFPRNWLARSRRFETSIRVFDAAGFDRVWLLLPGKLTPQSSPMSKTEYPAEYDAIVKTMQLYIDGSKQGRSELMRPAFHPNASFFGYAGEQLAVGTPFLFDWIDKNGPAPTIEPRVVSVEILKSIAVVQ